MLNQNRILLVFAHPDDESFTSGATVAKYVREKDCQIALLCATRGQAGKAGDPPLCSREELPFFRERELREAAAILGIQHVDVLDYEDGHLSEVPMEELIGHVASAIRKYQPQVVITFARHGISGHPDHTAICDAATQAVARLSETGSPVKKLYYCTIPNTFTTKDGKPPYGDPAESITTEITGAMYQDTVAKALLAHKTQHLSVERVFPGIYSGDNSHVRVKNYFTLAWHNLPGYRWNGKEHDLFAGIQ